MRRLIFWNMSQLYRKKDSRTGEVLFSTYPEEAAIQIYEKDYWWQDAWDPMQYGRDLDFSRPFLKQLNELNFAVPWPNKSVRGMVESDYCNQASYLKNCYLCFNGNHGENSLYSVAFNGIKETMDAYAALDIELCYELYQASKSFQCFFSSDIANCRNVWFSRDLVDCSDCFGCVNLRHAKYCIFNVQYDKEEYEAKLKEFNTGSHKGVQEAKRKLWELYLRLPHKYLHGMHNENVSGDYVYRSKNAHDVYEVGGLEDARYSENLADGAKDAWDYTNWGERSELIYECASCGDNCRNIKFCFDCWPVLRDSEYCLGCHSSSNLFGCVGLRNKQYCILNKQYDRDEYFALIEKIKKHMDEMPYASRISNTKHRNPNIEYKYGEFFPHEFSPLAYNEAAVMDYYPKAKEDVLALGLLWREPNAKEYEVTIRAGDLPDNIEDTSDDILKEIIQCDSCKKAYRILDRELQFLRRFTIALPRLCHRCRYVARLAVRNPRKSYVRRCQCVGRKSENGIYENTSSSEHESHGKNEHCPNEFETTYSPDRPEIVYCEQCYQAEVV